MGEAPHDWSFWRVPPRSFVVPLPSVWALEPVRRLAGYVELTGELCPPVPVAAFHDYEPCRWYQEWLATGVEVVNRASENRIKRFPQILARHSPIALTEQDSTDADPEANPRNLGAFRRELKTLTKIMRNHESWPSYAVEWATCRTLIDVLSTALSQKVSVASFALWPTKPIESPIPPYMLGVTGFYRILAVSTADEGAAVDVRFVNNNVVRISASDALRDIAGKRIATAAVGKRSATIVVTSDRGAQTQLTPRQILELSGRMTPR